eukprot:COSAG06_NODE_69456_length_197_cov_151.244898_1_plen_65_part_11
MRLRQSIDQSVNPYMRYAAARGEAHRGSHQLSLRLEVSGALSTALENPRDRIIITPRRTHNRIRS